MHTRYRGIFAALLSEIRPELTGDESIVRASVILSQMDGMTIFASHDEFPEKDYAEFARLIKGVVKAIVGAHVTNAELTIEHTVASGRPN